jgi:precorrin-6A/cobalt-precorrin-6A reductase
VILLIGGTAESAPLALALAKSGYSVLVSTATDVPLEIGAHFRVRRRIGPLDEAGMAAVVRAESIRFIVDATHPYAVRASHTAQAVAARLNIPCVALSRPAALVGNGDLLHAPDHETAARIAFDFGGPVLLTIGSRHLDSYARLSRERNLVLVARVLDHPDSLTACRAAGLSENVIIAGRGPFTVVENRELIRRFCIGVLVTKDSGQAGGVDAKVQAAKAENCRVVVVDRPAAAGATHAATSIADVLRAVNGTLEANVDCDREGGKVQ